MSSSRRSSWTRRGRSGCDSCARPGWAWIGCWRRGRSGAGRGGGGGRAARARAARPEPASVAALREAVESDPFWAVRAAAATALGRTRRTDALEVLEAARAQEHPRVRRAVALALGEFRGDARAGTILARWLEAGDPSCFVEANTALAL